MASNSILAVLARKGHSFAKVEQQFFAIMDYIRPIARFVAVAGIGGSRVALAFSLNDPQTDSLRGRFRDLELCGGKLATLKLELVRENCPCTAQTIHNSEIVRD